MMGLLKKLGNLFHKVNDKVNDKGYPAKCPYCGNVELLAKHHGWYSDHCLTKRDKDNLLLRLFTMEAEKEWFDTIICFNCYRIIYSLLTQEYSNFNKIELPTISELTGWSEDNIPIKPVILYDNDGIPVYGTKKSTEMYT